MHRSMHQHWNELLGRFTRYRSLSSSARQWNRQPERGNGRTEFERAEIDRLERQT
ncbi:MAG: hypothetical protein R2855_01535 [Thermomicrobiales bacterium]